MAPPPLDWGGRRKKSQGPLRGPSPSPRRSRGKGQGPVACKATGPLPEGGRRPPSGQDPLRWSLPSPDEVGGRLYKIKPGFGGRRPNICGRTMPQNFEAGRPPLRGRLAGWGRPRSGRLSPAFLKTGVRSLKRAGPGRGQFI